MADDTRQQEDLSKEALTVNPEQKPFTSSQWQDAKAHVYRPPENANLMSGGTENTAGGKTPEVTVSNAFGGALKWADFVELPKRPCVRDALMFGIGAGFAIGGARVVFGATVKTACDWAVGGLMVSSPLSYQWCQYSRQREKEGMMRAVEILNRKELEKKAREQHKEKAKEERRRLKEQEQDSQFAALRESNSRTNSNSWWKFW